MLPRVRRHVRKVALVAAVLVALACGARTGLDSPEELDGSFPDVQQDVAHDVEAEADAAEEDVIPPIDATFPDVPIPNDCPDAGSTLVYVIGAANDLYSFYPPTLTFTKIGTVACMTTSTPFSMAVNRLGIAYSVFTPDDALFQVSTANAACQTTPYAPNQMGFDMFGMGYASNPDGGESLYVIQVDFNNPSMGLGTIDTTAFTFSFIGTFSSSLTPECELTGTGDGRLYALCLPKTGKGSTLAQIDPATANIVGEDSLTTGGSEEALAFAFWGGDFWIFTSPGGTSPTTTVTEYDPVAKTETAMTTLSAEIVGAGVSTCAPQ
jgi:hypothetical protein